MTNVVLLVAGMVAAVVAWRVGMSGPRSAMSTALCATLATFAVVFNLVVPVSNVEATTLVVVCSALALGPRFAVVVGALAVLGTGAVAGLGPWTAWQVLGFALVAVGAAAAAPAYRRVRGGVARRGALVTVVVVLTVAYDVVVTAATLESTGMAGNLPFAAALQAALLLGLPFTLLHVVGNAVVAVVAAPSLLAALSRAGQRMGRVAAVGPAVT